MIRSPRRTVRKTLAVLAAPVCLAALAGGVPAGGPPLAASDAVQADTTLEMPTGDRIVVSVRSTIQPGIEICAGLGRGVRGGKSLSAVDDGRAGAAGLRTLVRFPGAGTTARCQPHRHTGGDTLVVEFFKQVRTSGQGLGRLGVGVAAVALPRRDRARITFRWVREGGTSVPAEASEDKK